MYLGPILILTKLVALFFIFSLFVLLLDYIKRQALSSKSMIKNRHYSFERNELFSEGCDYCGVTLGPQYNFCPKCGNKVQRQLNNDKMPEGQKPSINEQPGKIDDSDLEKTDNEHRENTIKPDKAKLADKNVAKSITKSAAKKDSKKTVKSSTTRKGGKKNNHE